jgi:hypothetical protein
LLDYLEHGRPLAEFLDDFPTVEKAQAIGVLDHMKQLVAHAPSSRWISVVVMVGASNDVDDLRPLLPGVEQALGALRAGEISRVSG